jgi:hypothetical protein
VDLNTFITAVFCLTDDWLQQQASPRSRGPAPELSDSEVLTIEIVGEFLGIDAEKGLYTYFRRHYGEWFPALRRIHRTTFTVGSLELTAATSWQRRAPSATTR